MIDCLFDQLKNKKPNEQNWLKKEKCCNKTSTITAEPFSGDFISLNIQLRDHKLCSTRTKEHQKNAGATTRWTTAGNKQCKMIAKIG